MTRTINFKAVLVLLAAAAGLGLATHFVHAFQVRRNAAALREEATQAEQDGKNEQAAGFLEEYLGMVPGDTDALAHYGTLLSGLAHTPRERVRAYLVLNRALNRNGDLDGARRQSAELGLKLGRFKEAGEDADRLLQAHPGDAGLMRLRGRAALGEHEEDRAAEWLGRATEADPASVGACMEYAEVLRWHLGSTALADSAVERLVRRNPRSVPARLAASRYFQQAGARDRAEKEVRFALEDLGTQDAEALLLAADLAAARNDDAGCRERLEKARALYPQNVRVALAFARLEARAGQHERAMEALQPLLKDLPTQPEDLAGLSTVLTSLGETKQAEAVLQHLREAGGGTAADYLRGRLLMTRGDWARARAALEKARLAPLSATATRDLNLALAQCYEVLQNPDQEAAACRRAAEADPASEPALRLLGAALAAQGKLDEAIAQYRRLADWSPATLPVLARLLIARNRRLPAGQQNWAEVEQVLQAAAAGGPPAPDIVLLRAEVLAVRGKTDEARKLVEAERARDPKQMAPWLFLAGLAEREGKRDAVLPLLAEAERRAGPGREWEEARLRWWAGGDKTQALAEFRKAEERLGGLPDADRDRLLAALAEGYAAVGEAPEARRLWRQLGERQPNNLRLHLFLFDQSVQAREEGEASRLLDVVRRLAGADDALAACGEASLRLMAWKPDDPQGAEEVRRLLARAAETRPSWSRPPLLEAQLYEREGHADKALEKYQAALERGEGRATVVRRVLQLLEQEGRYAEASALLAKLPEATLDSPDLNHTAAASLLAGAEADPDPAASRQRAVELVRRAAAARPADFHEQLWLGQICALAGQAGEAEQALRKARDLAPKEPGAWAALALFLAGRDARKADAELAAARTQLPPDQAPLVLGPGYEALGRLKEAAEQYRALAKARPDDPAVLRNVAGFYLRTGDRTEGQPLLRRLIDPATKAPPATVAWARRTLALTLAFGGNYRQFSEAQALLDENGKDGGGTAEDGQVRALVLATRPERRTEAIGLLEGLSTARTAVPPEFRFVLAQLYEAGGKGEQAAAELRALLAEHGNNPRYLVYYLRYRLRHKQLDGADAWLDRLDRVLPGAFEPAELRARVLHVRKQDEAMVRLVQGYARGDGARLDLAALLLDELGKPGEAEPLYRQYAAVSKDPTSGLLLAQHLAWQKRLTEALDVADRARPLCKPEAVGKLCLRLLSGPGLGDEQRRRVESWLAEAGQKQPGSLWLAIVRAQVQDQAGRYDEAKATYRDVLRRSPGQPVALNNLAFLLALTNDAGDEALPLIDAAIDDVGPDPNFLDTRGLVRLRLGQPPQAVQDLRQAVTQAPAPAIYFHLAQAELAAGNRGPAEEALRKALDLGLREEQLHALERKELPALRDALAVR